MLLSSLIPLIPLIVATPLPRQASPTGLSSAAIKNVSAIYERWGNTGAIIAYVSPGKDGVVSLGERDVLGNNVTEETYFAIASNTKLFTSISISMMIEDQVQLPNGKPLELGSLMKDIAPGLWGMKNSTIGDSITLLDVLSMRSGLPQHILATTPTDSPLSALTRTPYLSITAPSGQNGTYQYSNQNYEILASIPSLLLNQSIETFVQDRIFTPLGMGGTRNASFAGETERSMGFLRSAVNYTECSEIIAGGGNYTDQSKPEGFEFWTNGTNGGFYGGAGINLRGVDMVKWARELIKPTIFPPSISQRLQTLVPGPLNNTLSPFNSSVLTENIAYQAGLISQWYRGYKIYLHDGALPGSNSYFAWSPQSGVGVFVAANDDALTSYLNEAVVHTVLDDLLGLEYIDWEAKTLETILGAGSEVISGEMSSTAPIPSTPSTTTSNLTTSIRPPVADYSNTSYSDPAYGNLTLLPLNLTSPEAYSAAGIPFEYFITFIAATSALNLTYPGYYAKYNHSIVTHIIFTHFDGPLYNATSLFIADRLNSSGQVDGLTAKPYAIGPAVINEEGVGMFSDFVLQAKGLPAVQVVESGLKGQAPVFFERTTV